MRNPKKPLPVLENIHVTDASSDGASVARTEEYVVFIKGAIPGDVVDVQITRKKSKYREGKAIRVHTFSDKRAEPVCQHFGTCGGCKWQNMDYQWQLFYKQKQVTDALTRLAKIELPEISKIIPSAKTYHYRNKLEFTFSNKKWLTQDQIDTKAEFADRNALGFHIPGLFDKVLDIETCHLQEEPSNSIRLALKAFALENQLSFFDIREQIGLLRNVIIRSTSTGEWMLILSFFYDDKVVIPKLMDHLGNMFPQITSLQYVINGKKNDTISDLETIVYKGNDSIYEQMPRTEDGKEMLKFKIGPKSFYQTNSDQAYELYRVTREFANIQKHEVVYDLYTGTGTIANFVAHLAKKVVGVEYVPPAIVDAKINSEINGISNTSFYAGDLKDVLNNDFVNENGKPDVVITDPPRAGMHEDVTRRLLEIAPERIVYVSCNPATQARDLQILDEKYKVEKVQPVDMFPQTHHVENVVLLRLKN